MRRAILLLLVALVASCVGHSQSAEPAVRSALNALADVVDPAYGLAVDGCAEREQAELQAEKAGAQSAALTDQHLKAIRARCDLIRSIFEQIRDAHIAAVSLVEAGAVEGAEKKLAEVKDLWRKLARVAP